MRLTYEDKLKMYDLWKNHYYSPNRIARQYNVDPKLIRYIVHLMDCHGAKIVKHGKNKYYSPELKINAINRVLINHESIFQVSLELGLSNYGMLNNWIKSFIENGYNIIEKQRGCKSHEQKESKDDLSTIREGKQATSPKELKTYNRGRILKKIGCLSFTKRKPSKEEIAIVITKLRQELSCSLKFILDTISSNPKLPQITRSDYYYQCKKINKDMKNDEIMNKIISIFYKHKKALWIS